MFGYDGFVQGTIGVVIVHEASKRRSCVRREGVDRCRMRPTT